MFLNMQNPIKLLLSKLMKQFNMIWNKEYSYIKINKTIQNGREETVQFYKCMSDVSNKQERAAICHVSSLQ